MNEGAKILNRNSSQHSFLFVKVTEVMSELGSCNLYMQMTLLRVTKRSSFTTMKSGCGGQQAGSGLA